jgi:hypothetical protein
LHALSLIFIHLFWNRAYSTGNTAGNGQVEDGGYTVYIDGTALVPGGAAVELLAGKAMTLEIQGTSVFRGHYVRLGRGANNVATAEAFSDLVFVSKIVEPCLADDIAAFTHTDNGLKTSASATLTFPNTQGADTDIPLDVTIVVANCDPKSPLVATVEPCDPTNSTYYYSQYMINFALSADGSAPAPAPGTTSAAAAAFATNFMNAASGAVWMVLWTLSAVATAAVVSGYTA